MCKRQRFLPTMSEHLSCLREYWNKPTQGRGSAKQTSCATTADQSIITGLLLTEMRELVSAKGTVQILQHSSNLERHICSQVAPPFDWPPVLL